MTTETSYFVSHILELRKRVLFALFSYIIIAAPLIGFAPPLFDLLSSFMKISGANGHLLIATQVTSPFLVPLKLALILALFLSMPIWLYQLWAFVTPALYPHEKKLIRILSVLSLLLFYLGAAFCYFLVCPMTLKFFVFMSPSHVQVMTDIHHYLNFLTKMVLSFGLGFQVPLIVCLGLMTNLWSPESLKAKRPYIIVLAFVVGMLLTPPDVISQIMLAIPLVILFELGILLAKMLKPTKKQTPCETGANNNV